MGKFRIFTRIPVLLTKLLMVFPFVLFGLWLLKCVYFPQMDIGNSVVLQEMSLEEDIFKTILQDKVTNLKDHFHLTDRYLTQSEKKPPLCLTCHGTYPHTKEKKVRSILNFHTGFIACAVCHNRRDPQDRALTYAWVDRASGIIKSTVEGEYGKYSARIYPVREISGKDVEIVHPVSAKAAAQYLKYKDQYTADQISQAKIKLHENISHKPVFCSECHKKDGYLDFRSLGFSQARVNHLDSTEIVGLVEKYKTFYLPSEIDFGVEKSTKK